MKTSALAIWPSRKGIEVRTRKMRVARREIC